MSGSLVRRVNLATNPIGANVAATTNLSFTNLSSAIAGSGFLRGTISSTAVTYNAVQFTGGNTPIAATPGLSYTMSAEFRSDLTNAAVRVALNFFTGAGAFITGALASATAGPTSGAFTSALTATMVAPATTGFIQMQAGPNPAGNCTVGQIFDIRRLMVAAAEPGNVSYFDGSFANTAELTYSFTGTAELSTSVEAANTRRVLNQGSLTQSAVRAATI